MNFDQLSMVALQSRNSNPKGHNHAPITRSHLESFQHEK